MCPKILAELLLFLEEPHRNGKREALRVFILQPAASVGFVERYHQFFA
jgi:hypothetical protein